MTDFSAEAKAILNAFNDHVLQAIHNEHRVDEIILHDHLRKAICQTVEDPDSPCSEVIFRGTFPTPVAMVAIETTGLPYSRAKAKAVGKENAAILPDPELLPQPLSQRRREKGTTPKWAESLGSPIMEAFAKEANEIPHDESDERHRRALIRRMDEVLRQCHYLNSSLGPFVPSDIYAEQDEEEDDDEPAPSIIATASEAPTSAPPGFSPPPDHHLVLGQALDVLNAPATTRETFQALLRPPTSMLPYDLDEFSPELAKGTQATECCRRV